MPAGTTAFCLASELNICCGRDAERRQLGVRELDVDLLVLRAVEIDLGDVLDLQQALAQSLGDLLHLRVVGAVGR